MNRLYALGAVALTAIVLIFALQNLRVAPIQFIIWEVDASVSLVGLVAFLGGREVGPRPRACEGRDSAQRD